MTDDNSDAFEPHLGRSGMDGDGASTFKRRVMRAVGRAGGNPRRVASKTSGGVDASTRVAAAPRSLQHCPARRGGRSTVMRACAFGRAASSPKCASLKFADCRVGRLELIYAICN